MSFAERSDVLPSKRYKEGKTTFLRALSFACRCPEQYQRICHGTIWNNRRSWSPSRQQRPAGAEAGRKRMRTLLVRSLQTPLPPVKVISLYILHLTILIKEYLHQNPWYRRNPQRLSLTERSLRSSRESLLGVRGREDHLKRSEME